jgi:IclR family acetate operon transcriptional repressor
MRVLEASADQPDGVALSALAAKLGSGKGTLSKIVATLVREGFVRQDPLTGRFHLGWRLLALAFGHAERVGLPALCQPILQAIADETDELVQLAVGEGDQVFFVAKAEGPGQRMRMVPLVGVAPPVHATASGKAWLAHLPESEALAVIRRHGLSRVTARTVTSRVKLLAELRAARAEGFAIVDEELVEGGRAVAAPILVAGRPVGAVVVSGPTFRLSLERLRRLAPRVKRAAAELAAVWPAHATVRDFGLGSGSVEDSRTPRDNAGRRTR